METPDIPLMADRISEMISDGTLDILPEEIAWHSGVYLVLDTVFSARARYHSVVVPMLNNRMMRRPGMKDNPQLGFSSFIADVDKFGDDKFWDYSRDVLNCQRLAGRLKTEVSYEVASFFAQRNLETAHDLKNLGRSELVSLVQNRLRWTVKGIGSRLSAFLLMRLGINDLIKADVMVERFFSKLSGWKPNGADPEDERTMLAVTREVAKRHGITPIQIDSAIWRYQNGTQL